LGIRSGATPRGRIYSKPTPSALLRKADISTLLGIGHFYFALTGRVEPVSRTARTAYGVPKRVQSMLAAWLRRPGMKSSMQHGTDA
jgi:hypothetical protein